MRINLNLKLILFDRPEGKLLFKPFGYHKLLMAVFGLLIGGWQGALAGLIIGSAFDMQFISKHKPPRSTDIRLNYLMLGAFILQAGSIGNKLSQATIRQRLVDHFGEAYVSKRFIFFLELLQQRIQVEAICDHMRNTISEKEKIDIVSFLYALTVHSIANYEKINSGILYIAGMLNLDAAVVKQISAKYTSRRTASSHTTSSAGRKQTGTTQKNNLYKMFELQEDCNYSELKKAYYRLAKKYHPDSNPHASPTDQKRMQEKLKVVIEVYDKIKVERGWN